jgi:hypothetical protein
LVEISAFAQCALCGIARLCAVENLARRKFLLDKQASALLINCGQSKGAAMRTLLSRFGDRELMWALMALVGVIVVAINI